MQLNDSNAACVLANFSVAINRQQKSKLSQRVGGQHGASGTTFWSGDAQTAPRCTTLRVQQWRFVWMMLFSRLSLRTALIAHIAFNAVNDQSCAYLYPWQDASRCTALKDFVSPFYNGWGEIDFPWLFIVTLPAPVVPLVSRCGRVLGNYLLDLWHIHPSLCGNPHGKLGWPGIEPKLFCCED